MLVNSILEANSNRNNRNYTDVFISKYSDFIPDFSISKIEKNNYWNLYSLTFTHRTSYAVTIKTYSQITRFLDTNAYRAVKYKDRLFICCSGFLAEVKNGFIEVILCVGYKKSDVDTFLQNSNYSNLIKKKRIRYLKKYTDKNRSTTYLNKVIESYLKDKRFKLAENITELISDKLEIPNFKSITEVKSFKKDLSNAYSNNFRVSPAKNKKDPTVIIAEELNNQLVNTTTTVSYEYEEPTELVLQAVRGVLGHINILETAVGVGEQVVILNGNITIPEDLPF